MAIETRSRFIMILNGLSDLDQDFVVSDGWGLCLDRVSLSSVNEVEPARSRFAIFLRWQLSQDQDAGQIAKLLVDNRDCPCI